MAHILQCLQKFAGHLADNLARVEVTGETPFIQLFEKMKEAETSEETNSIIYDM